MTVFRILGTIAAASAAANVFLLGYPGDVVPQAVLIIVGLVAATSAAAVAYLSKPAAE